MESQTSQESNQLKALDEAFKSFIDDMKPFVLSLPEKKDRQRIALWIKKLCGPVGLKPIERKNRNLHAQILFQMLRKGIIAEPFNEDPTSRQLQILPAYLTKHLDQPKNVTNAKKKEKHQKAPDWIRGELPSTDSAFSELRDQRSVPGSEPGSPISPQLSNRSLTSKFPGFRKLLETDILSRAENARVYSYEDSHDADSLEEGSDDDTYEYHTSKDARAVPPLSLVRGKSGDVYSTKHSTNEAGYITEEKRTFRRRAESKSPDSDLHSYYSEKEDMKATIQELEAKISSLEAKFTKETVILHQEKDQAVQKVIDRKNTQIEGIKSQFRKRLDETEETSRRQEKKIAKLTRDLGNAINRNDNEVQELQAIIHQNKINAEHELERRVHDKVAEFEQEKFAMQKEHSQNIQELLDETNERLKTIENEYLQKIESSDLQIRDLEHEVYQLKRSRDINKQEKEELMAEKGEMKERLAKIQKEQKQLESRIREIDKEKSDILENHDKVLRDLRWKTDSTIESMKKENANASSRTSSVIMELEGKVNQYKQSLQDQELQRKRDLREQESNHKQEIMRVEVDYEKKIKMHRIDSEKMETELQNRLNIADQIIKEKEIKITQLTAEISDGNVQAQSAIENFKRQAEDNSKKIFQEMKQQISEVEDELKKVYRENTDLKANYMEETKALAQKYEKKISDLQILLTEEKERSIKDKEVELEHQSKDFKETMDSVKSKLSRRLVEVENALRRERESNSKKTQENDQIIRELRDEVIQANSLRKQQLVELGMLRDEEKQTFKRQEESMNVKFKSQLEQQRLNLQSEHTTAMETMLEKTNAKLKEIEREYSLTLERSQQTITQLQSHIAEVSETASREQSHAQEKIVHLTEKYEKEKEEIRRNHINTITTLHHDIEIYRAKSKDLEKRNYDLELQSQDNLIKLKLEYEERVRGLLPNSARMELEETITALREQIQLIQSRASLLQNELDNREELTFSFGEHGPQMTSSR